MRFRVPWGFSSATDPPPGARPPRASGVWLPPVQDQTLKMLDLMERLVAQITDLEIENRRLRARLTELGEEEP